MLFYLNMLFLLLFLFLVFCIFLCCIICLLVLHVLWCDVQINKCIYFLSFLIVAWACCVNVTNFLKSSCYAHISLIYRNTLDRFHITYKDQQCICCRSEIRPHNLYFYGKNYNIRPLYSILFLSRTSGKNLSRPAK